MEHEITHPWSHITMSMHFHFLWLMLLSSGLDTNSKLVSLFFILFFHTFLLLSPSVSKPISPLFALNAMIQQIYLQSIGFTQSHLQSGPFIAVNLESNIGKLYFARLQGFFFLFGWNIVTVNSYLPSIWWKCHFQKKKKKQFLKTDFYKRKYCKKKYFWWPWKKKFLFIDEVLTVF